METFPTKLVTLHIDDMEQGRMADRVCRLLLKNRRTLQNLMLGCERYLVFKKSMEDEDFLIFDYLTIIVHEKLRNHTMTSQAATQDTGLTGPILSVETLHLIGYSFTPSSLPRQNPLFAPDKIKSLVVESCDGWEETTCLPSPMALSMDNVPILQSFALRQEACTDIFQIQIVSFLQGFEGLQHLHMLLEGTGPFIDPDCFIKNHGKTLTTLVWEQRTSRMTDIKISTNTGTKGDYFGFVTEVAVGCLMLKELGLIMSVNSDGTAYDSEVRYLL